MKTISYKNALGLLLTIVAVTAGVSLATEPTPEPTASSHKEHVVLLHGLGRSKSAMWLLASRLEDAGYHVHRIGYESFRKTPEEIISSVEDDITACCEKVNGNIHFVGHSLGGLLIRAYLDRHRPENLGRVVMIGTPNQGTDFVDKYRDRWWMQFAGDAALSLGTDSDSFPNSLPKPYYPVGVIAGLKDGTDQEDDIAGADDGLVPLRSTPVDGMNDFVVVATSHSAMRYDRTVAEQTVNYLRHGRFQHLKAKN